MTDLDQQLRDEDQPGFMAGFHLAFSLGIGSLSDEVKRLSRQVKRLGNQLQVPRDRRELFYAIGNQGAAGTFPASGNLTLLCDGPQPGLLWEVRTVYVGGAAVNATPAGTAYVFFGSMPPADLSFAMAKDFSLTPFPVKGTWSTGVFKLRPPQNLYVVIIGGTAAATYVAYADINEYPDTKLMATVATE